MSIKANHLIRLNTLLFIVLSTNSFGQTFQWAKQIGGVGWDKGTSIATDKNNNIYTVGLFIETVDFDPGPGVYNLTSVEEEDAFICKLDSAGNFIWAKQYGDSAAIGEMSSVGIDSLGNLYTTNSFIGTVDFDPGAGDFNLTSIGSDRNIFVQKLDANGNFLWAKQIGAPYNPAFPTPTHSNAIAVDAIGNQYLTGYFDGTVDFDPDTNFTFIMSATPGFSDIFICKLDASGNFVLAKQFAYQASGGGVGYAIFLDGNSNIYSTGTIGGTVDFDPGPGIFYLTPSVPFQSEIYISKLDSLGNFVWAKTMGPGEGSAIAVDDNSNVYSSGWTPSGYFPVINKLDSSGNLIWAKQLGGLNGKSIALDNNGNVYTIGGCFGTNDFDPGPGEFILTGGGSDSFISKLDSSGNFVWTGLLTGTNQVCANSQAIDMNNNVYTTGYFNGTADFDPSFSIFNLTGSAIGYDIFIHKLRANVVGVGFTENSFEEEFKIYPIPTEGNLVIEFDREHDGLNIVLRNILGQVINTSIIRTKRRIEIQINEERGIYLLEISDQNSHQAVLKIMKK